MSNIAGRVFLRSWSRKDEAHLDSLLSADVDPLWREQFHGLDGPDRDGTDWRRTRIAVDDYDGMIGCASIVHNPLHPNRFPCSIEVTPNWRRRGIDGIAQHVERAARQRLSPLVNESPSLGYSGKGIPRRTGWPCLPKLPSRGDRRRSLSAAVGQRSVGQRMH